MESVPFQYVNGAIALILWNCVPVDVKAAYVQSCIPEYASSSFPTNAAQAIGYPSFRRVGEDTVLPASYFFSCE